MYVRTISDKRLIIHLATYFDVLNKLISIEIHKVGYNHANSGILETQKFVWVMIQKYKSAFTIAVTVTENWKVATDGTPYKISIRKSWSKRKKAYRKHVVIVEFSLDRKYGKLKIIAPTLRSKLDRNDYRHTATTRRNIKPQVSRLGL